LYGLAFLYTGGREGCTIAQDLFHYTIAQRLRRSLARFFHGNRNFAVQFKEGGATFARDKMFLDAAAFGLRQFTVGVCADEF